MTEKRANHPLDCVAGLRLEGVDASEEPPKPAKKCPCGKCRRWTPEFGHWEDRGGWNFFAYEYPRPGFCGEPKLPKAYGGDRLGDCDCGCIREGDDGPCDFYEARREDKVLEGQIGELSARLVELIRAQGLDFWHITPEQHEQVAEMDNSLDRLWEALNE